MPQRFSARYALEIACGAWVQQYSLERLHARGPAPYHGFTVPELASALSAYAACRISAGKAYELLCAFCMRVQALVLRNIPPVGGLSIAYTVEMVAGSLPHGRVYQSLSRWKTRARVKGFEGG